MILIKYYSNLYYSGELLDCVNLLEQQRDDLNNCILACTDICIINENSVVFALDNDIKKVRIIPISDIIRAKINHTYL